MFPVERTSRFRVYAESHRIYLTPDFLWLGSHLTIPLPAVLAVEESDVGGGSLLLRFWNELEKQEYVIWLQPTRLLKGRRVLLEELSAQLRHHAALAPTREVYFNTNPAKRIYVSFSCERCGEGRAKIYASSYFVSLGVPILAYVSREYADQRLLCGRHAAWLCVKRSALTGLVGYISLIGVFFAPQRIWRNAKELISSFPEQGWARWVSLVLGFGTPLLLVVMTLFLAD